MSDVKEIDRDEGHCYRLSTGALSLALETLLQNVKKITNFIFHCTFCTVFVLDHLDDKI